VSEDVLLDLCNQIWSKEQLPEGWKKGLLIKLPKKGDLSHCKKWRGIILLNMASKVFCLFHGLSVVVVEELACLDDLLTIKPAALEKDLSEKTFV